MLKCAAISLFFQLGVPLGKFRFLCNSCEILNKGSKRCLFAVLLQFLGQNLFYDFNTKQHFHVRYMLQIKTLLKHYFLLFFAC